MYCEDWNPYWNTSIYGAWAQVNYNSTAKGYICGRAGNGVGGSLSNFFGAGSA